MGNYEIASFNARVQHLIQENKLDDGNGIIEADKGELAALLSATGKSNINDLLNNALDLSSYQVNTESNKFLKDYIKAKAYSAGVQIPENAIIEVSNFNTEMARELYSGKATKGIIGISNEKYWFDKKNFFKKLVGKGEKKDVIDFCNEKNLTPKETEEVLNLYYLNSLRVNVYGGRVKDLFNLLSKDREEVERIVSNATISDKYKEQILKSKNFLDNYYKVNLKIGDKTFDLVNLTDANKEILKEMCPNNPQFVDFVGKMQSDLKKQTLHFAQKETLNEELSDSGQSSKILAVPVTAVLGWGIFNGFKEAKNLKAARDGAKKFAKYIAKNPQEGNQILDKCVAKLSKLSANGLKQLDSGDLVGSDVIARYMKKIGMEGGEFIVQQKLFHSQGLKLWTNPIKALKTAKGGALIGLVSMIAALSIDDVLGAVKDFFQDQNNFGTKVATGIGLTAAVGGVVSTAAVVPSLRNIVNFRIAEQSLRKFKLLPNLTMAQKCLNRGKWALLGIPLGIILTSSSSGSSWTSMGLTRWMFGINGNKLEKNNLITKEENTFKASDYNMMEYEAYKGKAEGITYGPTGDWTIGAIGGVTGAFLSADPRIQIPATVIQSCSETLTACGYQFAGNAVRENKLDKEKEALVASI